MVRTAINDEDARNNGVYAEHERMENGEVRCRFKFKDGTAYIRTEASSVGGWQRSHYHNLVHETYIVETGRIAFVDQCNGRIRLRIIGERGIITTEKRVIHNVYMSVSYTHLTGVWRNESSNELAGAARGSKD